MPSPENLSSGFNKIPDETNIGPTILKVRDLDKMLAFYVEIFGLHENFKRRREEKLGSSGSEIVELSAKKDSLTPLLVLDHDPNANQPPSNFAGLFHFAVLVPDRKSLAHAFLTLQRSDVHFEGFADHLVSESLYLHDPEHNGIEIYRDRPSSEWTHDADGRVVMDTLPLDLAGILSEIQPASASQKYRRVNPQRGGAFPSGARIGHMHLRVTNLERSSRFYNETLGFRISADWSTFGAMFLAAGGYHHHIGMNTWHSLNGKRHQEGEAGLDGFTIQLPKNEGSASYIRSLELRLKESTESIAFNKINENEFIVSDPDMIPIRFVTNGARE